MQRNRDEQELALADRLVNYADALAALAFVGVSGLGIAVADPDTRESVARGAEWVALANVITGVLISAILLMLRRWESDLRSAVPPSPKALRYSRRLHWARLFVVWFSAAQAAALMFVIR